MLGIPGICVCYSMMVQSREAVRIVTVGTNTDAGNREVLGAQCFALAQSKATLLCIDVLEFSIFDRQAQGNAISYPYWIYQVYVYVTVCWWLQQSREASLHSVVGPCHHHSCSLATIPSISKTGLTYLPLTPLQSLSTPSRSPCLLYTSPSPRD